MIIFGYKNLFYCAGTDNEKKIPGLFLLGLILASGFIVLHIETQPEREYTNMTYDIETLLKENVDRYGPSLTAYPDVNFYALMKAIMKRESDFNPNCIVNETNVGDYSIGLGQLRIDTAKGLYDFGSKTRDEIKDMLLDGRFNAYLMGKYLVKQLIRYSGNVKLTVSSYNAGTCMFRINNKLVYYDNKGFFVIQNGARVNVTGYDVALIDKYEINNADYVNYVMNWYSLYQKKTPNSACLSCPHYQPGQ